LTTQTNQMKHGYKSAARSLARLVDTNLGKDEVDWIYNAVIIMSWQQIRLSVLERDKYQCQNNKITTDFKIVHSEEAPKLATDTC
jgi:hypothetical protein